MGPVTVEASKTGWVSINLLSTRPDIGALSPPPFRMMTDAADLRDWIEKVRPLLESLLDSTGRVPSRTITFGSGRYQMEITFTAPRDAHFFWRACGPGTGGAGASPSALLDFVALLDTAAKVAGGGHGRPPTLSRPYYSIEVSCPAVAEEENPRPNPPAGTPAHIGDVGVEFIVDTLGRVEPGTIRVMPSVHRALADSVRAAVSRWHFQPAEIDGILVRQIVQTAVAIGPAPVLPLLAWEQVVAEASEDGWVRIRRGDPSSRNVNQEWYEPDSVDAFVARVRALNAQYPTLSKDTALELPGTFLSALGRGAAIATKWVHRRDGPAMQALMSDCDAFRVEIEPLNDAGGLAAAAHQARLNRTVPGDPASTVHEWNDVACRAWDSWSWVRRGGWSYPVGKYPRSMVATNARAEVLASFVVDTTGAVDMSTIEVMPASDRRAVAEIAATLATRRFRPAKRASRKVRQRVIEAIRFEPPPICVRPLAGPICLRHYSPR